MGTPLPYSVNLKSEGLTQGVTMSMSDNEYFYVNASTFTASEMNNGTSFTITFTADDPGTFDNLITIGNEEAASTFTVRATAVETGVAGDVNGDGEVNIADVNAVINIILGDDSSGIDGDVNGDNEVNIADVNSIIAIILGL